MSSELTAINCLWLAESDASHRDRALAIPEPDPVLSSGMHTETPSACVESERKEKKRSAIIAYHKH